MRVTEGRFPGSHGHRSWSLLVVISAALLFPVDARPAFPQDPPDDPVPTSPGTGDSPGTGVAPGPSPESSRAEDPPPHPAPEGKPIRAIEIRGLSRQGEGAVRSRMKLQIGEPFRKGELNREITRLWKTGEFAEIDEPNPSPV